MPDNARPQYGDLSYEESRQLTDPLYIDVRSPGEFALDHLPNAYNLPVFDDAERAQIGAVYRNQSPAEARFLGLELISAKLPRLLRELQALSGQKRPLVLYCWRGGMRSQALATVAGLMYLPCYRLKGGYRDFRCWLAQRLAAPFPFAVVVLHGLTGCGKTRVLQRLRDQHGLQVADLEGLANHRGSVFGSVGLGAQPSQKQFQSRLWQLLGDYDPARPLLVECESRRIGRIILDQPLFEAMKAGRHILLYDTVAGRARRLVEDYAPERHLAEIEAALLAPPLRKRLAAERISELTAQLQAGEYQEFTEFLLHGYYDPLYCYPEGPSAEYELCVDSGDETRAAREIAAYLQTNVRNSGEEAIPLLNKQTTPARPRAYLLSLGCSKNQVDSEGMRGLLQSQGIPLLDEPDEAEVLVVNTCGFILSAKQESINALLELAHYKEAGNCRLLVAVGCLVEKYRDELKEAMPEVDLFLGSREYGRIASAIGAALDLQPKQTLAEEALYLQRARIGPAHTAYLKIAEGCDNHCTYCLIPQLRGPYRSRPLADLLQEAQTLAAQGVKELVLLAQDSTAYGLDLTGERLLPQLLTELAQLPFRWIRLLYAYPDGVDARLLAVMAAHTNICHYLDIPLQHADDAVLKAMGRKHDRAALQAKLDLIRSYLPDVTLRTTMMVGFPGETAQAFARLLAFVRENRFDWLGAFAYSREEDTPAYDLAGQVEEDIKQQRLDGLMQAQAEITAARLTRFHGQSLDVLVEGGAAEYGPGWWWGRTAYQAPEVDGVVYFKGPSGLTPGLLGKVRITGSEVYDLAGAWEESR